MINKLYNKTQDDSLPCSASTAIVLVQEALEAYNRLVLKDQSCKIELDRPEGQDAFKDYMEKVEALLKETKGVSVGREFRETYTNAYKVLYQDSSLGYIPEIYDSAQEGFPFIYVNGEKYDFSPEVLMLGERLVESYYRLPQEFRVATLGGEWLAGTRAALEEFDRSWATYEQVALRVFQKYICELIGIQNHSKSAIRLILEAEESLSAFQRSQQLAGRIFLSGLEYDHLRRCLCQKISRLNSVANLDGKGRDDLSFEILAAAENVLATVTELQSRSVRALAQRIRQSYGNVREVLRFFGENFQMVDPQLKNNPELVLALQEYQNSWEKGKRYFLDPKKEKQIVAFSSIVQAAREKYAQFKQLVDCSDPSIFWIIPSLIVLRSLQDEDQGLAQSFLTPALSHKHQEYLQLRNTYLQAKEASTNAFTLYNHLESLLILNLDDYSIQPSSTIIILNKLKEMAVSLQRVSPLDWNDMLGVLLTDDSE